MFFSTRWTLNEKQMAAVVCTIDMGVTRRTALVTSGDYIVRNSLASALVKDKVLADKLIVQTLIFHLPRIFNDAAFELVYTLKPFVFETVSYTHLTLPTIRTG